MAPKKRPASSTPVKAPPEKKTKKDKTAEKEAEDGPETEDNTNEMKEMIDFLNSVFEPEKKLEIEEVTSKEEEKVRNEDYLKVLEWYLERTDKEGFPGSFAKIKDEIDRMKALLEPKDTEDSETEEKKHNKKKTTKAAKPAAKNKVTKPKSKAKAKTAAKTKSTKPKKNPEEEKKNDDEEGKKKKHKGKTALLEETGLEMRVALHLQFTQK